MSDHQTLQHLKNSDPNSLEELFHRHYGFLTRIVFYITKDKEAAEDLTQDLFVKLWERRETLPEVINLKAYLVHIVRNSALDYIKRKKTGASQLDQFLYFERNAGELSPEQTEDLKNKISDSLSHLPPKCRLIFSLNRFEGLTNDEIAEYLEISKRTVETQISKALKIMRKELKDIWDQNLFWTFL